MSASAVSITANTAARRRPVLVEKKSTTIELLPAEAPSADKLTSQTRDLSHHYIRGEPILDKDLLKKSINATVIPRRPRKVVKPEKPRWMTVVSVFAKNLVLLLVLVGLVQMVRRLSSKDSMVDTQLGFSEFEKRISEVEDFVKSTSGMLQVQVDVVSKKMENEIGALRSNVRKKIEDQSAALRIELEKFEEKSRGMEKLLSELKAVDWLSKEEFNNLFKELKKGKKSGSIEENEVTLDDIRVYAREIVEKEIEKHASDGLGRVDFALASAGAKVVKHSEPFAAGKGSTWLSQVSFKAVHEDAEKMLKPSFGEPGQCFPLKGSSGFVQIKLRTAIVPEAVTLEHVSKSVAFDRSSAPKDCRISGWQQGPDQDLAAEAEKMVVLTEFTYDLEKSNAQTFTVSGSGIVDTVRLEFTSNHESASHTCIYRLRVHGHEPASVSMLPLQS